MRIGYFKYHLGFKSKTGKWEDLRFKCPTVLIRSWHDTPAVGSNNGILYWSYGKFNKFVGIIAVDPFKVTSTEDDDDLEGCRLIRLPDEFGRGWKTKDACLGVAQAGGLRLCQFYWDERDNYHVLKTWLLDDTATSWSNWLLVHDLRLKMGHGGSMSIIGYHPEGANVFFFQRKVGKKFDICQYQIGKGNKCYLRKFPNTKDFRPYVAFTLVHPWWPTTIPALPSI